MPAIVHATACEIVKDIDLGGQTALVTGGNSGIGYETVRALAGAGARVLLTSRSMARGQLAADKLNAEGLRVLDASCCLNAALLGGVVVVKQLDLADLSSVQQLRKELQQEPRLDILILNAGIMGGPLKYTTDGFELNMGTNHIAVDSAGHFALVEPLIDQLRAQVNPSRVVVVSSFAHKLLQRGPLHLEDLHYHRRRYSPYAAYSAAKTANILFAKHLAIKLTGSQASAFAVHPGVIMGTGITQQSFTPNGALHKIYALALRRWLKTPQQGAATQVWAATAPGLEALSGAYFHNCAICQPSATAGDPVHASALWDVTAKQIQHAGLQ